MLPTMIHGFAFPIITRQPPPLRKLTYLSPKDALSSSMGLSPGNFHQITFYNLYIKFMLKGTIIQRVVFPGLYVCVDCMPNL